MIRHVIFCLSAGLFTLGLQADEEGTDWPGIRGPGYDGHSSESGLVDTWPNEGPPVLWTRELGQGYSSFAVWNNRAATQYQSLRGQCVVCLDAESGRTLWEYHYDWPYDPAGVYPGPRATPTYDSGRLYFASPAGLIGCLNAENGELLWSVELPKLFGAEVTGFGYACSPTVIDDLVLLPVGAPGASLVALDARSGAVRWKAGQAAGSYAPAFPISFRGRSLVLGYLENELVCHDRVTGDAVWTYPLSQGYDEHSSWPIYREPWLWISSPFRAGSELLELTDDPQRPIVSHGKGRPIANDIFSSVLVGDAIFGFDVLDPQAKTHRSTRGVFRCTDFLSGTELWSAGTEKPLRSPAVPLSMEGQWPGHCTVLAADGKLILFNDLGELILLRATRERYEPLARTSLLGGEICWTQPALSRGRLFVRNHTRAACVYLRDPTRLKRAGVRTLTPADIPQTRYVDLSSMILGVEPEYAFDLPSSDWLVRWFLVCLAMMVVLLPVSAGIWLLFPVLRRQPWYESDVWWLLMFFSGCLGTTLLSQLTGDFVFTWPLALFAVYQPLMDRIRMKQSGVSWGERLQSGLRALLFLAVCGAYYFACRRLSLVFEWAFLTGFPIALPVCLAGRLMFRQRRWYGIWKLITVFAAFAAAYWGSVVILTLRVA